jgi:phosphoribosylformimino-5-aminoimidazole carboxamide ribotide isomerase
MSFDIVGVVDLRRGLAVRARGGRRDMYAPIESVAGERIPAGDATALARQYVDRFGLTSLYAADLDAMERREHQHTVIRAVASTGASVWVDAGITSVEAAQRALDCGVARVIVGLETLPSFAVLESIVQHIGGERVVFSLDLRDGTPLTPVQELMIQRPEVLASRAAAAGVAALIVLDLARVGAECGLDLPLLSRLRTATGSVPLYAGGGVRSIDDLRHAMSAGCAGTLVASALQDGLITDQQIKTWTWT